MLGRERRLVQSPDARVSALRRGHAPQRTRSPGYERDSAAGPRVDLPRVRLLRRGRNGRITRGQRAPSVSSTSLRTSSSKSAKFSAVSHSSQSTSITAGRPSSFASTRESRNWTICICRVLTRKFWSFPQLGQVRAIYIALLSAVLRPLPNLRIVRERLSRTQSRSSGDEHEKAGG